jgi:hypothetical protein
VRLSLGIVVALAALVPTAAAGERRERVAITPRVGDVNTTFVYRGAGWHPRSHLALEHGALCGATQSCTAIGYVKRFHSTKSGRFKVSEHPASVPPDDLVGYSICFEYASRGSPGGCRARGRITVVPPAASATPARVRRFSEDSGPSRLTLAAQHFKAGARLRIHIRYPAGRERILHGTARRRGGYVGAAYAPRGGLIRVVALQRSDPDGTYEVRVSDARAAEARTSSVLTTSP